MIEKLEEIIFTNYNHIFNKDIDSDYYEEKISSGIKKYLNLQKVITFLLYYKGRPRPLREKNIKKEIIITNSVEYISFDGILTLILNRNNYYEICELHILMGFSKNINFQNMIFIESVEKKLKYSLQTIFTYTIYKYLYENFNISITTEYEIKEINYRCDIFIKDYNIIIEFYELWHEQHIEKDKNRQHHIESLGYDFLFYDEKNEHHTIRQFINKLELLINNKKLLINKNYEFIYINNKMLKLGYDKLHIKQFYNYYNINNKCQININDCYLYLGFFKDSINKLKHDILESLEPYEFYEADDTIYINSNGFKILLLKSKNNSKNKRCYLEIESLCLEILKNTREYLILKNVDANIKTYKLIHYMKNTYNNNLMKSNKDLKDKIKYLEELLKEYQIKNKEIKKTQNFRLTIKETLNEGDIIVPNIPEIKYTNNIDSYITITQLKLKLDINNSLVKQSERLSLKYTINLIKKKIGVPDILFYNNILPYCKIDQ